MDFVCCSSSRIHTETKIDLLAQRHKHSKRVRHMPAYAGRDRNENEGECNASKRSLCVDVNVYGNRNGNEGEGEKYY